MASRALKIDPKKMVVPQPETVSIPNPITETTEQSIAALAYQLWQSRGCPIGSPEVDWLQAEQALKTNREPASVSA